MRRMTDNDGATVSLAKLGGCFGDPFLDGRLFVNEYQAISLLGAFVFLSSGQLWSGLCLV